MAGSPPRGNAGSAVYTPFFLFVYDVVVLGLSNTFLWKCPTSGVLLPLFRESLGRRHLDVGVGSGYFPAKALSSGDSKCRHMTLVDLNPNALAATARRVVAAAASHDVRVTALAADATRPLPLPPSTAFDSISLLYLLHCIPGAPEEKTRVFDAVRPHLGPRGVLFGATILGRGRPASWLARAVMTAYNWRGIFGNAHDEQGVFEEGLRRNFEEVEVWCVGVVMLFRARGPKADVV